jgi:hypothetical protein
MTGGTAWSFSGRPRSSARIPMRAGGARSTIGTMAITATFTPPSPKIVPTAAVSDISHTAAYPAWARAVADRPAKPVRRR